MTERWSLTPVAFARRLAGTVKERPGSADDPFILWCLESCQPVEGAIRDEIAWCSAFVSRVAWIFDLPRSVSLSARSWLSVGASIPIDEAESETDVVVLRRGTNVAQGHVGWYVAHSPAGVMVCGGNQSNAVSVARFPLADILDIRRLRLVSVSRAPEAVAA